MRGEEIELAYLMSSCNTGNETLYVNCCITRVLSRVPSLSYFYSLAIYANVL